eukprot:m.216022 g.216022  ORF g.216022 m.216022 type:complete len:207 (+) comp13800_c1_seq1:2460-3080(+)
MSEEPKIEDVTEEVDSDNEEMPELVEEAEKTEEKTEAKAEEDAGPKQSRSEKKARKALSKLNLKPVSNITRVAIRRNKNFLFVIQKPDVFKSPNTDTYVVFGEARIEDLSQNAMASAAEKLIKEKTAEEGAATNEEVEEISVEEPSKEEAKTEEAPKEAAEESADGVDNNDVELVMHQGKVSREEAVAALEKSGGDIVNAIMSLTM